MAEPKDIQENTPTQVNGVIKSVEIVNRSVGIALASLSPFIWSYEQIKGFVSTRVADKLKDVPPEQIVPPKPHIAVPVIEALRYVGAEEELSDLYANLLASSMDAKTVTRAHPSFVEIIKQLTPDEARLLKYFSTQVNMPLITLRLETGSNSGHDIIKNFSFFGEEAQCTNLDLVPSYLDNLARLGVIKIPDNYWYTDDSIYNTLREHPTISNFVDSIIQTRSLHPTLANHTTAITKKQVQITDLGKLFIAGCVNKH